VPERPIAILFATMLLGSISLAQTPLTSTSTDPVASSVSRAAAGSAGWDSLKQLGPQLDAKVVLTRGESYRGALISVSDDSLAIHSGKSDRTIARSDVNRISIRRPNHRGRNALIGAGIGAGAGLGMGTAVDQCSKTDFMCTGNWGKGILTPFFGLAGAGVGALLPTGGWHEVYRVR